MLGIRILKERECNELDRYPPATQRGRQGRTQGHRHHHHSDLPQPARYRSRGRRGFAREVRHHRTGSRQGLLPPLRRVSKQLESLHRLGTSPCHANLHHDPDAIGDPPLSCRRPGQRRFARRVWRLLYRWPPCRYLQRNQRSAPAWQRGAEVLLECRFQFVLQRAADALLGQFRQRFPHVGQMQLPHQGRAGAGQAAVE
ncbi:hypothetical protein D3C71_930440 [compost metagenome]